MICKTCGTEYQNRNPIYCSRKCVPSGKYKRTEKHLSLLKTLRLGQKHSEETKIKMARHNEQHHFWKGAKVGYRALHDWVYRHFGSPVKCKNCGTKIKLQWANKDHKYKRDRKDWVEFCIKCHCQFDKEKKLCLS